MTIVIAVLLLLILWAIAPDLVANIVGIMFGLLALLSVSLVAFFIFISVLT